MCSICKFVVDQTSVYILTLWLIELLIDLVVINPISAYK